MRDNGLWLRDLREGQHLTQAALGESAEVSEGTISNLERGKVARPREDTAKLLVAALKLSEDDRDRMLAWPHHRTMPLRNDATPDRDQVLCGPVRVPPTRLIGREEELADVVDLICNEDVHLVTVTGPGGIGKTRVAVRAAELAASRFPGGTFSVDLSGLAAGHNPAAAIAAAVAAPASDHDGIVRAIGDRQVLLLLDTLEHLAAGPAIARLVGGCPRLTILATSQVPLSARGEHQVRLSGLAVPAEGSPATMAEVLATAAGELFSYYADLQSKDWRPADESAGDLARVCRAVAGLPLSLEFAAAWTDTLPLSQIAARLETPEGHLEILSDVRRDGPDRHKAIAATISGSLKLLTLGQQRLLKVLATRLASAWTLPEARAAASRHLPGTNLETGLRALVAHSFVNRSSSDGSYLISNTVRQYLRSESAADQPAPPADGG